MSVGFLLMTLIWGAETNFLEQEPWTGDWLSSAVDVMVHGENYQGYPGPMPKFWLSQGLDVDHASIHYEMVHSYGPTLPNWYGQCEGWAAAAVIYDTPTSYVVNGVKFSSGEHKAFLSTVHRDQVPWVIAGTGDVALTPQETLFALRETIGKGEPVIFDVDRGEESWNFPVWGYVLSDPDAQGIQKLTITLVDTRPMALLGEENEFYDEILYFSTSGGDDQWISGNPPGLAWQPSELDHAQGDTRLTGNRYFYPERVFAHAGLASQSSSQEDFYSQYEPSGLSHEISSSPVLGALLPGSKDQYWAHLHSGETLECSFFVYEGPALSVQLVNDQGLMIREWQGIQEQFISWDSAAEEVITVQISGSQGQEVPAYYALVPGENAGHFFKPGPGTLAAFNPQVDDLTLNGLEVSGNGAAFFVDESVLHRSTGKTLWEYQLPMSYGSMPLRVLDHPRKSVVLLPHVTFKFGWDTVLDLYSLNRNVVRFCGYNVQGQCIVDTDLPMSEGHFSGSLAPLIPFGLLSELAWAEVVSEPLDVLYGAYSLVRDALEERVSFLLGDEGVFGEIFFPQLVNSGQGWNGLALVNTSIRPQELLWQWRGKDGSLKQKGRHVLEPGQKWLTTLKGLLGQQVEDGEHFYLFSHFPVHALMLQWRDGIEPTLQGLTPFAPRLHQGLFAGFSARYEELGHVWLRVDNMTNQSDHLLFEAFDEDGALLGRFNIRLGKPVPAWTSQSFSLASVTENGFIYGDLSQVAWFRVKSPEGILLSQTLSLGNAHSLSLVPLRMWDYRILTNQEKNHKGVFDVQLLQ
jgi:hypothetical protein